MLPHVNFSSFIGHHALPISLIFPKIEQSHKLSLTLNKATKLCFDSIVFTNLSLFFSFVQHKTKQSFCVKKKKRKKKGISLTQKKKISSSFKCHNSLSKSVIAYVWGWNFVIEWSVEWYYGDFLFSIIIILFYFIFPLFLISYFCQNFCFML